MLSNRTLPILLIALCLFVACKKETKGGGSGTFLDQHLHLSVDSLCVQAPNVFTLNGDGMNDIFVVQCSNAAAFSLIIRNEVDSVVFSSTNPNEYWDGVGLMANDSLPTSGGYHFAINVTGTSGAQLSGNYVVYVVLDDTSPCFNPQVSPVFGDQFDPRVCGITNPSNDVVCVW